jgi:hypothetical protein
VRQIWAPLKLGVHWSPAGHSELDAQSWKLPRPVQVGEHWVVAPPAPASAPRPPPPRLPQHTLPEEQPPAFVQVTPDVLPEVEPEVEPLAEPEVAPDVEPDPDVEPEVDPEAEPLEEPEPKRFDPPSPVPVLSVDPPQAAAAATAR